MCSHYCLVKELSDKVCYIDGRFSLASMREYRMWFARRECVQSCDLPLSFYKWRLMEINPVIASMPNKGKVLNAPSIHMATLIFLVSLADMIVELYDNIKVRTHREQLARCSFYREVISDGGSTLLLNYQGSLYIWQ